MSRLVRLLLWIPRAVLRGTLVVLAALWRVLTLPFHARGVARERLVISLIVFLAIAAAVAAYPPIWDWPAARVKANIERLGGIAADRFGAEWPRRAAEIVSPEPFPALLGGRDFRVYALGLDLVGGAHLEYVANTSEIPAQDLGEALAALRGAVERRVNILGVREPLVQLSESGGEHRVIVELAGITDVNEAIATVGRTAALEFREESAEVPIDPSGQSLIDPSQQFTPTGLTGQYLKRANVAFNATTNQPQVQLEFNPEGAELFQEVTGRNVGKRIAIFLDDEPLTAPTVNEEIAGGTAVITGSFTLAQARFYAELLNAGALPVPVELVAQRTVGATLGAESFTAMVRAGIATVVLIAAFMAVLYRLPGLLALTALLFYIAFLLALFKLIPMTLTLAGIAGFILSIGMAVDANILIFARMREELRAGRTALASVEEGFSRAWTAIRDSNVSTLLTTVILYEVGTSFVQGFAFALGVGVVLSMLTAVYISRYLLREAARHAFLTKRRLFW